MARRNPMNDMLTRLAAIRSDPKSEESRSVLLAALAKGLGVAVGKAAEIVSVVACGAEAEEDSDSTAREEFIDEEFANEFKPRLAEAFDRLLAKPDNDRGARGKVMLARALNRLDYGDVELYLRGVGHTQFEPEMGGQFDKAGGVRAASLFGLVRLRFHDRLRWLTDMLWDDIQDARLGAVRACLYEGAESSEMLLRAKAHAGDKGDDIPLGPPDGGPLVMGEVFTSLLALGRGKNVPFIAAFVSDKDQFPLVRNEAAMALGGSRMPEALAALAEEWGRAVRLEERERLLVGVAMNGTDEAMTHLTAWAGAVDGKVKLAYRDALESVWGEGNPRLRKIFQ